MARSAASFRDPAGFVFEKQSQFYRQINDAGRDDYDLLMASGLYRALARKHLLIPHTVVHKSKLFAGGYKVIKPLTVPFISYPYEWSFSQLKDAALLTLRLQKAAIKYDMSLKDASAYNIQFLNGQPIHIDTLSFEKQVSGEPWKAYKQFCQHFLAPLALMAYTDIDLAQLLKIYIDGIPLPLTAKLLPDRAEYNPGLLIHIRLHARSQQKYADSSRRIKVTFSANAITGLLNSLERTVKKLRIKADNTEWAEYYKFTNYRTTAFSHKKQLVIKMTRKTKARLVLDLGANNGLFSRLAAKSAKLVVSADIDPLAVEDNYQLVKKNLDSGILPIRLDLTNPSPDLGWALAERESITKRCRAVELVMALALIHHLAISNNLPFEHIADYFQKLGLWLIIEFVPKTDSQVKKLLVTREDIFTTYDQAEFEKAFSKYYSIIQSTAIKNSRRTLYLMQRN